MCGLKSFNVLSRSFAGHISPSRHMLQVHGPIQNGKTMFLTFIKILLQRSEVQKTLAWIFEVADSLSVTGPDFIVS